MVADLSRGCTSVALRNRKPEILVRSDIRRNAFEVDLPVDYPQPPELAVHAVGDLDGLHSVFCRTHRLLKLWIEHSHGSISDRNVELFHARGHLKKPLGVAAERRG